MSASISIPTIHTNGTTKSELQSQLLHACNELHNAREALLLAMPNGRDYYPQGNWAIDEARSAHVDRIARIEAVRAELMTIWQGIDEQS